MSYHITLERTSKLVPPALPQAVVQGGRLNSPWVFVLQSRAYRNCFALVDSPQFARQDKCLLVSFNSLWFTWSHCIPNNNNHVIYYGIYEITGGRGHLLYFLCKIIPCVPLFVCLFFCFVFFFQLQIRIFCRPPASSQYQVEFRPKSHHKNLTRLTNRDRPEFKGMFWTGHWSKRTKALKLGLAAIKEREI